MKCIVGATLLLALLSGEMRAHAQDCQGSAETQARALYEAGRTAYDAGRYRQAETYFTDAYDLCRRPAFLFNIASAADRGGHAARAIENYRAFLREVPDAPNRELAENRIAALEGQANEPEPETEQTESSETAAVVATSSTHTDTGGGGDVTSQWWFWTIIVGVVVVAAVGIGLGVGLSSSGMEGPLPGTVDYVFTALTRF